MQTKERVYQKLKEAAGEMTAREISELGGVGDRTYVSKNLTKLVAEGKARRRKVGRHVYYKAADMRILMDEELVLRGLSEDLVWLEAQKKITEVEEITEQAEDILNFAFTEMLNNAIDHSKSGIAHVKIWEEDGILKFVVRDFGIGIFRKIMARKRLRSEDDAIWEVLKGKLTTDPERHSGEGIFWTSKIADKIMFSSYGTRLVIDNLIDDYAIERLDEQKVGTEVYFEVYADTRKSMHALFHQYSFDHEKVDLDTTVIPIKLYESGGAWISRSQAKKVLHGLEKFRKVTFDFSGIDLIGQGFADEIFRVWQIQHPEIELEAINMEETVELLVNRAKNDRTGRV